MGFKTSLLNDNLEYMEHITVVRGTFLILATNMSTSIYYDDK